MKLSELIEGLLKIKDDFYSESDPKIMMMGLEGMLPLNEFGIADDVILLFNHPDIIENEPARNN